MAKKKRKGVCVYCGGVATTRDHVVPRALFDVPPPEGYITVPACGECNNQYSLDEEYFAIVVMAEGSFRSEIPDRVLARWSDAHRSGKRSRAGLALRLRAAMEAVDVRSAAGLHLGRVNRIELETPRVNRVLTKILKGLFFHEIGHRLPDDVRTYVEIKPDPAMLERPPFSWVRSEHGLLRRLGDVLVYRYVANPDGPESSVWLFGFYDSVPAAAATVPIESADGVD